jgi:phosphohistidine phosphatase
MKTLLVIRHAKSSWANPLLPDFERPLNDRGLRDAPQMAKRLKEKEITPDIIITSPAKRARTTCKIFVDVLQHPTETIKEIKDVYHADEDTLLNIIQSLPDKYEVIFLFGHNPGLTDFVNKMVDEWIQNIPTCGVVGISFRASLWKDVHWKNGELKFFDFPKKHKR